MAFAFAGEDIRVSYEIDATGEIKFMVKGVDALPSIILRDPLRNEELNTITNFLFDDEEEAYIADWYPVSGSKIFEIARLMEDDREVVLTRKPLSIARRAIKSSYVKVDRTTGIIEWTPNTPSLIRVDAVLRGGMHIKTLVPWRFCPDIPQAIRWDYWDDEHVLNYKTTRHVKIRVWEIPLPWYLVASQCAPLKNYESAPLFSNIVHVIDNCNFDILFPTSPLQKHPAFAKNIPVVHAGDTVEIRPHDPATATRHGAVKIRFYVNGRFMFEEPYKPDASTYLWPKFAVANAVQYITVNVISADHCYGTKTVPVWFSR